MVIKAWMRSSQAIGSAYIFVMMTPKEVNGMKLQDNTVKETPESSVTSFMWIFRVNSSFSYWLNLFLYGQVQVSWNRFYCCFVLLCVSFFYCLFLFWFLMSSIFCYYYSNLISFNCFFVLFFCLFFFWPSHISITDSSIVWSGVKELSKLPQTVTLNLWLTEENHSNEHASYEIPPVTDIFESPVILSLDSLLKKIAYNELWLTKSRM